MRCVDRARECALAAVPLLLSAVPVAQAHHSFAGFYDADRIVEIEGTLTSMSWANPHGRLGIAVTDAAGNVAEWDVETGSISVLRARGILPGFVALGDTVRVAGEASVRNPTGLYARQMLLADGREVLLSIGVVPRWTDADTGELLAPVVDERVAAAARRSADGVFRVWSTVLDDPASFPMFKGGYPLTPRGEQTRATWDPSSITLNDCTPKAMPLLMISPYPIELRREGDDVVMRFEEDNAVRRIHMLATEAPDGSAFLGHSIGHWDGATLVVETTHLPAELFEPDGVRQSERMQLLERFAPTPDGARLDYSITITDPETFTAPFTLERYFVWRPEITVNDYDCVPSR